MITEARSQRLMCWLRQVAAVGTTQAIIFTFSSGYDAAAGRSSPSRLEALCCHEDLPYDDGSFVENVSQLCAAIADETYREIRDDRSGLDST